MPEGDGAADGEAEAPGAEAPGASEVPGMEMMGEEDTSAVGEVVTLGVTSGEFVAPGVAVTFIVGLGEGAGFVVHPASIAAASSETSTGATVLLRFMMIPFLSLSTTLVLLRAGRKIYARPTFPRLAAKI